MIDVRLTRQLAGLRHWTALMGLVLLGVTWPLWWAGSDFPAVPFWSALQHTPLFVDRVAYVALVVALLTLLSASGRQTRLAGWAWSTVLLAGIALLALDQHRLQPWFYQLLIFAVVFLSASAERAMQCLMAIVISIYCYSAIGKLDAEFLHTVGQQFFSGLIRLFAPSSIPTNSPQQVHSMAWVALLPLSELLLAVGLAWPVTRRMAGGLACLFHLTLMLLLGPWGLDHSAGVVCWNIQFAGQAIVLFVLRSPQAEPHKDELPQGQITACNGSKQHWGNRLATVLSALVIILPLAERWGRWDHWTSWALYAPHSSRTEVWIAVTSLDVLPSSLQQLIAEQQSEEIDSPAAAPLWVRLPLERWSLEQTRTPIYPQARFQLGVARSMAQRVNSPFKVKAILHGVAARWDGARNSVELQGTQRIASAQSWFWLGTTPRSTGH